MSISFQENTTPSPSPTVSTGYTPRDSTETFVDKMLMPRPRFHNENPAEIFLPKATHGSTLHTDSDEFSANGSFRRQQSRYLSETSSHGTTTALTKPRSAVPITGNSSKPQRIPKLHLGEARYRTHVKNPRRNTHRSCIGHATLLRIATLSVLVTACYGVGIAELFKGVQLLDHIKFITQLHQVHQWSPSCVDPCKTSCASFTSLTLLLKKCYDEVENQATSDEGRKPRARTPRSASSQGSRKHRRASADASTMRSGSKSVKKGRSRGSRSASQDPQSRKRGSSAAPSGSKQKNRGRTVTSAQGRPRPRGRPSKARPICPSSGANVGGLSRSRRFTSQTRRQSDQPLQEMVASESAQEMVAPRDTRVPTLDEHNLYPVRIQQGKKRTLKNIKVKYGLVDLERECLSSKNDYFVLCGGNKKCYLYETDISKRDYHRRQPNDTEVKIAQITINQSGFVRKYCNGTAWVEDSLGE